MIVETDYPGTQSFKDRFSNYFVSQQSRLMLDAASHRGLFDTLETLPHPLRGRVNRYRFDFSREINGLFDVESGVALNVDLDLDHPEALLVRQTFGGGRGSLGALRRLRLRDPIVDALVARLAAIGSGYAGVHIRNTDYQTGYRPRLEVLAGEIAGPVFVATDNRQAIADCVAVFGAGRVHSFSRLPAEPGRPVHILGTAEGAFGINTDAILDVMTLALSDKVYGFQLDPNPIGATYSGFTLLAIGLHDTPALLRGVIGRRDPMFDARFGQS